MAIWCPSGRLRSQSARHGPSDIAGHYGVAQSERRPGAERLASVAALRQPRVRLVRTVPGWGTYVVKKD
jgi:hypothetical protein